MHIINTLSIHYSRFFSILFYSKHVFFRYNNTVMKKWHLTILIIVFLLVFAPSALGEDSDDRNDDGFLTAADAACAMREPDSGRQMQGPGILLKSVGLLDPESKLPEGETPDIISPNHLYRFAYREPVITDTQYTDSRISVTIEKIRFHKSQCYVADIYVRSIDSFRTAFSSGEYFGDRETVQQMAKSNGAVLAMSGDFYSMNARGAVIRNGELFRYKNRDTLGDSKDMLVLYRDGTMKVFGPKQLTYEEVSSDPEIMQLWIFGPILLNEYGRPKTTFQCGESLLKRHPRGAIGYYEPGHYCFVIVDGRNEDYSLGMTMTDLSDFMYSLGCSAAYNLDGGQSACMVFMDQTVNRPAGGGRKCSDILLIG